LGGCIERLISDVLSIKLVLLAMGDVGAALVYLQLKPKMEYNKYVEDEFTLLESPKGKHIMDNIPVPKPIEPIEVKDEKDECEDSGGLEHRGRIHPTNKNEDDHTTTPPQPQEGDDEDLDAVQGEYRFKRVFRKTRTQ
ncbi:hypothetical protein KI387_012709, partial [Taxus chinensis]